MQFVQITARQEGFRRAGLAHPARPMVHPADAFTADQLAALEAEPMLVVARLELADPAGPGDDTGGPASSGQAPEAPAAAAKEGKAAKTSGRARAAGEKPEEKG